MHGDFEILSTLSVSLFAALLLGFITQRLGLSAILGYLLAGVVVGPKTPGFNADPETAAQFAEIGVILLMFGVGLHFRLKDLWAVRRVAVPGAIGQILVATTLGMLATVGFGWDWGGGLVVGIAISVASTVVLIRVLTDNQELQTNAGHIAVGWLIVEDIFTVLVLVILPAVAALVKGSSESLTDTLLPFGLAILKIAFLAFAVLWGGQRLIPHILVRVAQTRNRELFTLATLAVALTIATGSSVFFGVSMALGAFLAGMVVGQSEVGHQAAADALPMRDAFAVLFFVSVGMLFSPMAIVNNPLLFLALLAVILVAKPLTAMVIVWVLGYSPRAALIIAIALAQIGEFSFILADLAAHEGLVSAEGQSLLVACAIVSLALNPLLFRGISPVERWLRRRPRLWKLVSSRSEARARKGQVDLAPLPSTDQAERQAIIVGYGPVGETAASILKAFGVKPVIVDTNVDRIAQLRAAGEAAVYGDGANRGILEAAGIASVKYLLVTVPDVEARTVIVLVARELNPDLKVFVRARYLGERAWLEEIGVTEVCYEEAEAAIGLASLLLREVGADGDSMERELRRIRGALALQQAPHHVAS